MADSTRVLKIGVIAEEHNDVEVLYALTCKLIPENRFSFKKFVGHGCGKLTRKSKAWAGDLVRRGCEYLVVMHDLDRKTEKQLRSTLQSQINLVACRLSVILIPIEELEAWLLADSSALKDAFNMRKVPRIGAPESIRSPKEYLGELVARNSNCTYLNTTSNRKIAERIMLSRLIRNCPSFRRYPDFIAAASAQ